MRELERCLCGTEAPCSCGFEIQVLNKEIISLNEKAKELQAQIAVLRSGLKKLKKLIHEVKLPRLAHNGIDRAVKNAEKVLSSDGSELLDATRKVSEILEEGRLSGMSFDRLEEALSFLKSFV